MEVLAQDQTVCRSEDIAAYIDGELPPADELRLESHVGECTDCRLELNEQKNFLFSLEQDLAGDAIELPKDFAKKIVANAESGVAGSRRTTEILAACGIFAVLLAATLYLLGDQNRVLFSIASTFADKVLAIGSFAVHTTLDISLGVILIIRSIASQVRFSSAALAWLFIAVLATTLILIRRMIGRLPSTGEN